jgi:hypothetical protein
VSELEKEYVKAVEVMMEAKRKLEIHLEYAKGLIKKVQGE